VQQVTLTEAIRLSGRSERTIQRAKDAGQISAQLIQDGRTRKLLFNKEEIVRWAQTARVQPAVVTERDTPSLPAPTDTTSAGHALETTPRNATERHGTPRDAVVLALAERLDGVLQAARRAAERAAEASGYAAENMAHARISRLLTLSVREAAHLSGAPQSAIRAAIAAGALRARKIGRGKRITQSDLRRWIQGEIL
jgi:excisionase family DNA binding protein